jgi:hypothetical protein
MQSPELDQLEQFLGDLWTPYLRYMTARYKMITMSHESPPASLARWVTAANNMQATLETVHQMIMSYTGPGSADYDAEQEQYLEADAARSIAFAPES